MCKLNLIYLINKQSGAKSAGLNNEKDSERQTVKVSLRFAVKI